MPRRAPPFGGLRPDRARGVILSQKAGEDPPAGGSFCVPQRNIEEFVKTIEKMPSLSPTVAKIVEIANSPTSSPKDLNTVISMDPVLTARVLKLVNSAYFGLSSQVTNILRAIILLGLNTIKNLALSTAVLSQYGARKTQTGFDSHAFWKHSLGCAVIAKLLAKLRGVDEKMLEEYFIAGLLHDIGKVVLEEFFAEDLKTILKHKAARGSSMLTAERQVIGVDHAQIGKWLGEKWLMTKPLLFAIEYHHRPLDAPEFRETVGTVFLANNLAKSQLIGTSGEDGVEGARPEILEAIGLTAEQVFDLEPSFEAEFEKASAFLKVAE